MCRWACADSDIDGQESWAHRVRNECRSFSSQCSRRRRSEGNTPKNDQSTVQPLIFSVTRSREDLPIWSGRVWNASVLMAELRSHWPFPNLHSMAVPSLARAPLSCAGNKHEGRKSPPGVPFVGLSWGGVIGICSAPDPNPQSTMVAMFSPRCEERVQLLRSSLHSGVF